MKARAFDTGGNFTWFTDADNNPGTEEFLTIPLLADQEAPRVFSVIPADGATFRAEP